MTRERSAQVAVGAHARRRRVSAAALLLVAIGLLSFLLLLAAVRADSVTVDEVAHIYAGYSYLTRGDFRLDPEHPPLLKEVAGFPLLLLHPRAPQGPEWDRAGIYYRDSWRETRALGERFLYSEGNDLNALVFWARFPFLLLSLVLGWLVYVWAKELYGPKAGVLAAFLTLLLPTLLAHGHLANTDMLVLFTTGAVYFWARFLKAPRLRHLLLAGLFVGLAFAAKYTAVLLLPMLLTVAVGKGWYDRSFQVWRRAVVGLLVIGLVAPFLVWASYDFSRKTPPPVPVSEVAWGKARPPAPAAQWLSRHPSLCFPADYYKGLLLVTSHAASGHVAYLFGARSTQGWWYYFLLALLVKTPLAAFIFIGLGIWYASRKPRPERGGYDAFVLLASATVFLIGSSFSRANLGVRHVLPIFPFLFIYAAQCAELVDFSAVRRRSPASDPAASGQRRAAWGFALLVLWYLSAACWPPTNPIAYFNELVGGPNGGAGALGDSNLDWGQDLNRVREFLAARGIAEVYMEYPWYDQQALSRYGLRTQPVPRQLPPEGYAVFSVSYLQAAGVWPLHGHAVEHITPGVVLMDLRPSPRAGRASVVSTE